MLRAAKWLIDYWYIPFIALGAIVWYLLVCRDKSQGNVHQVFERVSAELEVIEAKQEARDLELTLGHEAAVTEIRRKFTEKRVRLDQQQADKAKELEHDPQQLAKYLSRIGRTDSLG